MKLKRLTISVSQEMEVKLGHTKRIRYYKDTQSEMIRDLIIRGLDSLPDGERETGRGVRELIATKA